MVTIKKYRRAVRAYQERHRQLGLCAKCNRKRAEGHVYCEYHLEWLRRYSRAKYLRD